MVVMTMFWRHFCSRHFLKYRKIKKENVGILDIPSGARFSRRTFIADWYRTSKIKLCEILKYHIDALTMYHDQRKLFSQKFRKH